MKRPKFIGLFPSRFPGWGRDERPVFHHKMADTKDHGWTHLAELEEKPCDMAFHPPGGGPCMSCRYVPEGVSGIDAQGNCWVLVRDLAYQSGGDRIIGLVWVKFPVGVSDEDLTRDRR